MIYAHVPNKEDVPGQKAYFVELLRVDAASDATITEDQVITLRYMLAGPLVMRYQAAMNAKQGQWTASYLPTDEHARQALSEMIQLDSSVPARECRLICELTVGLTDADLIQIESRKGRGISARFRAKHWKDNHLGRPVIEDNDVVFTGGCDAV
jgi:hypothetical protein